MTTYGEGGSRVGNFPQKCSWFLTMFLEARKKKDTCVFTAGVACTNHLFFPEGGSPRDDSIGALDNRKILSLEKKNGRFMTSAYRRVFVRINVYRETKKWDQRQSGMQTILMGSTIVGTVSEFLSEGQPRYKVPVFNNSQKCLGQKKVSLPAAHHASDPCTLARPTNVPWYVCIIFICRGPGLG